MRSTVFTATLLSLGALTTQTALAAGDTRVVLDTVSGNEAGQIPRLCSFPIRVSVSATDHIDAPKLAFGVAVHAKATMSIKHIGTWFAGSALVDVQSGPGFFAVSDAATQEQLWTGLVYWQNVSSPQQTAHVDLPDIGGVTLERGHDYIISYAAVSYLDVDDDVPDPELCASFGSKADPADSLLAPIGYGTLTLNPERTASALTPIWDHWDGMPTSVIPSFSVTAIVGDTDEDGFNDDNDNCIDLANSSQTDFDHDGLGDVCDNCPYVYNPDQGSCSAGPGGGGGGGGGLDDGTGNVPPPASSQELGCNAGGAGSSALATLLTVLGAVVLRRRRRTA